MLPGGAGEDTGGLQRLAWGMGPLGKPDNYASVYLATGKRYRVARTIELIAQHQPDELTNRERQSLRVEDAARFGLRFDDPEDFFLLHEGGKFSSIDHIERSLRVTDGLQFYRYGLVMRPYIVAVLETYRELERRGLPLIDLDNSSLRRVDKITFRTPDYQLSTALDYRKGAPGSQQHIWQATLGPNTVVFTMNPGGSSKYWQGRLPRVAQHRNVLVAIYDIPADAPARPAHHLPARRPRRRRPLAGALRGAAGGRARWRCSGARPSTRSSSEAAGPSAARARATWRSGRGRPPPGRPATSSAATA